jgi:hypothetical protein
MIGFRIFDLDETPPPFQAFKPAEVDLKISAGKKMQGKEEG